MSNVARDLNYGIDVTGVAIDPRRYLTQLLTNLTVTPISQISQRLPDRRTRRSCDTSGWAYRSHPTWCLASGSHTRAIISDTDKQDCTFDPMIGQN